MKKTKKDILEEVEEVGEDDGESKGRMRESVEKRKKQKKQDRVARWSGFILLLMVMLLGFVLWVAGESRGGY